MSRSVVRPRIRVGRIALAVVLVVTVAYPVALATFRPRPSRSHVSTAEAFAAEPRDEVWAAAMESHLRGLLRPAVAKVDGTELVEVECHSRSCRVGVSVSTELKERLNRRSPHGLGFAMDSVLLEAGPLAPRRSAAWDNERPRFQRLLGWLAFKRAESAVMRWRLERLEREHLIVHFDDRTREVADQARWNASLREKIRARRRS